MCEVCDMKDQLIKAQDQELEVKDELIKAQRDYIVTLLLEQPSQMPLRKAYAPHLRIVR